MAKLKYDEDFPARAEDLARQGLRDIDIAKKLGISHDTFYNYQKIYPEFSDAIKKGKAPIDFEVENALLKRARGFEYEETHVEFQQPKPGQKAKPGKVKKIKKFVAPDSTACIFWLKNRRPRKWRDKHDIDLGGNIAFKIITAVPRPPKKKDSSKESPLEAKSTRDKK